MGETAQTGRMSGKSFAFPSAELGELHDASSPAGNYADLRQHLADDGYLLLRQLLDRDAVLAARRVCVEELAGHGCLDVDTDPMDGVAAPGAPSPPTVDSRQAPIWELFHDAALLDFFTRLYDAEAMVYAKILVRIKATGGRTGIHYDNVYIGDGSKRILTLWTPLGDVRVEEGALALCAGSHDASGFQRLRETYGRHNPDRDAIRGADNAPGHFSWDLQDVTEHFGGQWLTTNFAAGDVLIFPTLMLHCGLENTTNRFRISADPRYQPARDPVDPRFTDAATEATLRHRYALASGEIPGRTMEQARKDWKLG